MDAMGGQVVAPRSRLRGAIALAFATFAFPMTLAFPMTVVGCGARTTLTLGEDAGPPDAGRDAGRPLDGGVDAGRRPDAGVRIECRRDADCRSGVCRAWEGLRPEDLDALPLTCGEETPRTAVGDACRNRVECGRGMCAVAGTCVRPCVADTDCDGGERCRRVWVQTALAAMQSVDACTAAVVAPDDVRVAGPDPGPTFGIEATVEVLPDLSPHALVLWETDPDAVVFVERIQLPDGSPVFDAFTIGEAAPTWGVSPVAMGGLVSLLYPNGPNTPPSPEGYAVSLTSMVGASSSVRTIAQRTTLGTRFDVDAYLVGGNRWTAPDGTIPGALRRAFDLARGLFAAAGLTLGEVRVHELVGGLRERFSVLRGGAPPFDISADLPEMFRLSAGATRPSVHIFFVREIEGALGVASGIPGAQILPGTGASGVAIAADFAGPGELPIVIVHEVGHFMGLFHTTELAGDLQDPLPDTPYCSADADGNGDGFVDPSECRELGADNVMFWAGQSGDLTAQQSEVMRRAFFVEE